MRIAFFSRIGAPVRAVSHDSMLPACLVGEWLSWVFKNQRAIGKSVSQALKSLHESSLFEGDGLYRLRKNSPLG
jgi:hypothetical protein